MKKVLLFIWQLPQYIVGYAFIAFIKASNRICRNIFGRPRPFQHSDSLEDLNDDATVRLICLVTGKSGMRGVSFGPVVALYVPQWTTQFQRVLQHELGHSRQSQILGPLYLLVVGLPSLIVTSVNPRLAQRLWVERWADKIARDNF